MRGRPVLGAISGLFLGLTVGLDLVMFKVLTLGTISIIVAPAAGFVLGIILGVAAPFGRSKAAPTA